MQELLAELNDRLPELEWQINHVPLPILRKSLPRGLFSLHDDFTGSQCINDIKADIANLKQQSSNYSKHYLAEQIKRKINVLVTLCQIDRPTVTEDKIQFDVAMLSTRQQWLQQLETQVMLLTQQQQSLETTLAQMKRHAAPEMILKINAQLGAVEKELTLKQEALQKATATIIE